MKNITFLIYIILCAFVHNISAQNFREWQDTGNNWSNDSNWAGGYTYAQLEFKGNGNASSNNDFSPNTSQWRLFFNGAKSYTLTGNPVNLFDFGGQFSWVLSESTANQTVMFDVNFGDSGRTSYITTKNTGAFSFNNINVGSSITQLNIANLNSLSKITFNGVITGTKNIIIGLDENGSRQTSTRVEYISANTYTGDTFIDAGTLTTLNSGSAGNDADLLVALGASFNVSNTTAIASIKERGSGDGGDLNIALAAELTINGVDKGNLFQNRLLGEGDVILNTGGNTVLILYGNSTHNGTITIKNGARLRILGTAANSNIVVEDGGVLEIEGADIVTLNSITLASGGSLILNGNKTLSVSGNIENNGTISLSNTLGGDLRVAGDFIQNGILNNNNRAVFFTGANNQDLSGTSSPIIFDYFRVDKVDGNLTISEDIVINQTGGGTGYEQVSARVLVSAGKSIEIKNGSEAIVSGGTLEFNSSSTAYSSFIANSVSGAGTIKYNRYVNNAPPAGSTTDGNDLISPPVSGQAFNDFIDVNTNILADTNSDRVLFGGFDNDANAFDLWDESNTTTLEAGAGYRTGITAGQPSNTVTFEGAISTGMVGATINNGTSSRFNLIGNPYPSYLNAKAFIEENMSLLDDNAAVIYGYTDETDQNSNGNYRLITLNDDDYNLAPGQGFFVASNATGGETSFLPSMRRIDNTDDFIMGRNAKTIARIKILLENGSKSYRTDVVFNASSSLGLDPGFDASVYNGKAPAFSIYSNLVADNEGVPFAIQAVGETDYIDLTIPLGVNANMGEQITFSIQSSTVPESVNVYLDDNLANKSTLLNTSDYTFTPITKLEGTGRFQLRFSQKTLSHSHQEVSGLDIYTSQAKKEIVVNGQLAKNSSAKVFDVQGRLVKTMVLDHNNQQNRLDVSHLRAGIYVIQISNMNQVRSEKLILK